MYVAPESVTQHLILQIFLIIYVTNSNILYFYKNELLENIIKYHNWGPHLQKDLILHLKPYPSLQFCLCNSPHFNLIYNLICFLLIRHIATNYFAILLQIISPYCFRYLTACLIPNRRAPPILDRRDPHNPYCRSPQTSQHLLSSV